MLVRNILLVMPPNFRYNSNVSEAEFQSALEDLYEAILEKDTPEEWARFTGRILIGVAQIAISQIGYGPALNILEEIFGDDQRIIELLKLLKENDE